MDSVGSQFTGKPTLIHSFHDILMFIEYFTSIQRYSYHNSALRHLEALSMILYGAAARISILLSLLQYLLFCMMFANLRDGRLLSNKAFFCGFRAPGITSNPNSIYILEIQISIVELIILLNFQPILSNIYVSILSQNPFLVIVNIIDFNHRRFRKSIIYQFILFNFVTRLRFSFFLSNPKMSHHLDFNDIILKIFMFNLIAIFIQFFIVFPEYQKKPSFQRAQRRGAAKSSKKNRSLNNGLLLIKKQ